MKSNAVYYVLSPCSTAQGHSLLLKEKKKLVKPVVNLGSSLLFLLRGPLGNDQSVVAEMLTDNSALWQMPQIAEI